MDSKHRGHKHSGLRVRGLQVHLLTPTPRHERTKFNPYEEATVRKYQTSDPESQSGACAPDTLGNGGWCGKDCSSNHAIGAKQVSKPIKHTDPESYIKKVVDTSPK